MAKSRSIAAGLIHGLDRLDQPVYLLDCERRIVFANAACVDWLGLPLDSIVGQSCDYHSLADGTSQSVACGLSPPPDVFRGQRLVAPIHQTTDENPARRLAEFIPLLKENELELVLAIVAATDLPADDVEQLLVDSPIASFSPQEYQCLHEQMAQFRARAAQEPRFDRLLGNTPAIQLARSQVQLAIVGSPPTTIVGPHGSGRRAVARMIHQGATDDRVWLGVDCAAVTDESLVAAIASMTARTRAAGITLVLEGLDELSEAAQLKLEQITAGNRPVSLHLIASSLQTPATLLQQQRLRPGLASQLSTLVIELPPLSQRRDDIPLLCQSLVEEANAASSKQLRGVAPDCLDQLQAYQWPGNLHELANTVREAHRHAEGAEITISDLPKRLSYAADEARRPAKVQQPIDLEAHLESIESELIQKTLKQAKGNKSRAAQLLGLTRPKLYRRMVQLGLEEAEAPPAKKQRPNHRPRRKLPDLALPEAMLPAFESAGDELPDFIEDLPFEEQPE